MANHLPSTQFAPAAATTLDARVAALELFAQHLVFVLDVHGALQADALTRWIDRARARMIETGSVPVEHAHALGVLLDKVQQ